MVEYLIAPIYTLFDEYLTVIETLYYTSINQQY